MIGYTRAHRDRFNHPLFATQKFCRGYAWDWMVAQAAFKPHDIEIKGQTITLDRGQFSHSMRYMTKAFGWSLGVTQRFIDRLKTEHMIDTATNHGQIIITICKYDTYQAEQVPAKDVSDTPNDTAAIQDRYSSDTNKKEGYNNDKEGKVLLPAKAATKKPAKRKSQIPEDAVITDKQIEYASDKSISLQEAEAQFSKFKNDAIAKGKMFVNWDRAYLTWITSEYFRPILSKGAQYNGNGNSKSEQATLKLVHELDDATGIALARLQGRSQT